MVGREPERVATASFLERAAAEFTGLVLRGAPGIGKTTVWREAVAEGAKRGYVVLSCRPAETEVKLAFASLADLFSSLERPALERLPEPQRQALEAALLLASPASGSHHSRAVGTAVVSVVRNLAEVAPVLIAIDDAQWLDRASESVLSFALRRVRDVGVGALVAERVGEGARGDRLGLERDAEGSVEVLSLGPLSLSSLYFVLKERLGRAFSRPALRRIEHASGGNPLFALELARALDEVGGRPSPGEPLPIPDRLSDLLGRRVDRLKAEPREVLLLVACSSDPTLELVERVLGEDADTALEAAVRAGVVEVQDTQIRLAHPLLADAVLASTSPESRRTAHRKLAAAVEHGEERARHLALATAEPDEFVARALEDAARDASRRGAPETAMELLDIACRLTPSSETDAMLEREIELANAQFRAGETAAAMRTLDALREGSVEGAPRAKALELAAHIHWAAGSPDDGVACCEEALEHVGPDAALRARVLVTLARVTMNVSKAAEITRAALELLDAMEDPDPRVLSEALTVYVGTEFGFGRGLPEEALERALELERVLPSESVGDRFSASLGTWLKYAGDFDGARYWLEKTRQAAIDEGDESSLPYALSHLPQLELWTGNWRASEELALEHLELAERTGQAAERITAIYSLASVYAHNGRTDDALTLLEAGLKEAEHVDEWNVYQLLSVLGFVELSRDDPVAAVGALERAIRIYEASGAADTPRAYENYAEALTRLGQLDTADSVVDAYESRARAADRSLNLASALRCRALLAAARQDLDSAAAAIDEALAHHARVDMPFSRARTLLVAGQVHRRRGERRTARDALEEGLAIFERLGSPQWAERTRDELGRIPMRRRSEGALTAAEERVADLVAQGRTNHEVAQALFVSEKTVEANLTRIYRKLGVRSRTALAARLAEPQAGPGTPKLPAKL